MAEKSSQQKKSSTNTNTLQAQLNENLQGFANRVQPVFQSFFQTNQEANAAFAKTWQTVASEVRKKVDEAYSLWVSRANNNTPEGVQDAQKAYVDYVRVVTEAQSAMTNDGSLQEINRKISAAYQKNLGRLKDELNGAFRDAVQVFGRTWAELNLGSADLSELQVASCHLSQLVNAQLSNEAFVQRMSPTEGTKGS